jgi:O-antigen ligase
VQKGAERPLLGWGYTEEDDNRRLVGPLLEGKRAYEMIMRKGLGPHNAFLGMFFENGAIAALFFVTLFFLRVLRSSTPFGSFDVSLIAYIAFMSSDAMNPGGLTFLGYYLGICLLAVRPSAVNESRESDQGWHRDIS